MNFRSLKLRLSFYCNCLILLFIIYFSFVIEWSKIQKKNEMQIFLTFHYFGGAGDEILPARGNLFAEPAGAAFLEGLEELVGLALEAETVANGKLVEGDAVGVVVGIIMVQEGFDFLADGVGEGYAARVFLQQRLEFGREEVGVGDEQLAVLFLPFVTMWLHVLVFLVCFEVGGFVEEDPEEEVGVEVAVDADFVKIVVGRGTAVVAEFRHPFPGDVEVDLIAVEIVVDPIHGSGRQVVGKDVSVFLFGCHAVRTKDSRSCCGCGGAC